MATKRFIYPSINPIAAYPVATPDPRYHTDPFVLPGSKNCYCLKWETGDITTIQFLSDWVPVCTVYRNNGTIFDTLPCTVIPTTITTPDFTALCYQVTFNFSTWPVGVYNARITYTDDTPTNQILQQMWLSIAVSWPDTALLEYNNDENAFGVLFNTGILFNLRVEAVLIKQLLAFTGDTYVDENENPTALPSNAYETWTLSTKGIPDWLGKILNLAVQCTFILIDGRPLQKIPGTKWTVDRADQGYFREETMAGYSIDMMLVDNAYEQRLKTGNITLNGYVPIQQKNKLLNLAADTSIQLTGGLALFEEVCIVNNSGVPFTLNLGKTAGASDIAQFDIPASDKIVECRELFKSATGTVYISGITGTIGADYTLVILWKDLNAVPVTGPGSIAPPVRPFKNGIFEFEEVVPGDFAAAFDITTGLGLTGTIYDTCVICDGRNGTNAIGGKYKVGWLSGDIVFGTQGQTIGSNSIVISDASQLPQIDILIPASENGTGNGSHQKAAWSDNELVAQGNIVSHFNGPNAPTPTLVSQPITNQPLAIVSIFFKCLS